MNGKTCATIEFDDNGGIKSAQVISGREGTGTEIRFKHTPSGLLCPSEILTIGPGHVCASAESDIHEVANMQPEGNDLITLHIYSPPLKRMNAYKLTSPVVEQISDPHAPA